MSNSPARLAGFRPGFRAWLSVAGSTLSLAAALAAPAQRYVEVTAELELLGYRGDDPQRGSNASPRTVSLTCVVGTNEWRIDHNYIQGGKEAWYFDGTNVYNSLRVTEPTPEETRALIAKTFRLATAPFEAARSNVTINIWLSRDGHPLGDAAVNIAWLALASGTYLKREDRLVPLPLDMLHHTRDRFAYTDKTETLGDEFGLPRRVDLFLSRSRFLASEEAFDREAFFGNRYTEWVRKTVAGLPEGARMFHYEVTAVTNFAGWAFPLSFECSQQGRKFEQNGDWCWRGSGRVKSIRSGRKPEGLFLPSLPQTIVDWRFHDEAKRVDAITYRSTNDFALPMDDPALQEKLAKKAKRAAQRAEEQQARN